MSNYINHLLYNSIIQFILSLLFCILIHVFNGNHFLDILLLISNFIYLLGSFCMLIIWILISNKNIYNFTDLPPQLKIILYILLIFTHIISIICIIISLVIQSNNIYNEIYIIVYASFIQQLIGTIIYGIIIKKINNMISNVINMYSDREVQYQGL